MDAKTLADSCTSTFRCCGHCGSEGSLVWGRRAWRCRKCGSTETQAYPNAEQIRERSEVVRWFARKGLRIEPN